MAAGEGIEMKAELIEKAVSAAWKAHKSPEKHYLVEKNTRVNPSEVIISFPASGSVKDWYSGRTFGETKIDLTLFPSLKSIGNNEAAKVNEAFLKRFQDILDKSAFKDESTRARLCLRAAGESEARKGDNEEAIKKKKAFVEERMKKLEEYREMWSHQKVGYYDGFKIQDDSEDFKANVKRLELAGVWDEIIEKLRSYELPDEFEGDKEWIEQGTRFRRLVEPLDIANYYRHPREGTYMDKGRPRRYRYVQRWLEHAQGRAEEAISESCFWAEVEDLWNMTTSDKKCSFENVEERVVRIEEQIRVWSGKGEVGKDVFLEGSTLVKWWKALPLQHRQKSCIRNLVEE